MSGWAADEVSLIRDAIKDIQDDLEWAGNPPPISENYEEMYNRLSEMARRHVARLHVAQPRAPDK